MPQPANRLSRLPLRSKLSLLAAVPLVGMMVLSALVVVQAGQNRAAAVEQRSELSRIELTSKLVLAVLDERDALFSTVARPARIEAATHRTDAAADAVLALGDLTADRRRAITDLGDRIVSIRERIGSDVSRPIGDEDGQARATYQAFNGVVADLIGQLGPDTTRVDDASAMIDITTVQVMTHLNESIRAELLGYVAVGLARRPEAAEALRLQAVQNGGRSEKLEQATVELTNPRFEQRFEDLLSGQNYQLILELRRRMANVSMDDMSAPSPLLLPVFEPLFDDLGDLQEQVLEDVSLASERRSQRALIQLLGTLMGALIFLGAVAFLVAVLFRAIRSPLSDLTHRSRVIARSHLPAVVATIRELGGDATVEMPVPIPSETDDEIGELVDAFNQLHRTAVELAAEQASSRRTVSEMFVNLGRRNQKLIMRLLSSLESLERNEQNPEALEQLFKVDHLATRMRRNAESLLVLAGARTSRSFTQAIPIGDVVRAALSEVEDYERVTIDDDTDAVIDGKAVADLGHLLAELIENALQFSPPTTPVEVVCRAGSEGLVVAVGDRGIGLTSEQRHTNNQRIRGAAELTETPSRFLGLYVVGRLASRHGIEVELHDGVPSGLIARVALPADLCELPRRGADASTPRQSVPAPPPMPQSPAPPDPQADRRRGDVARDAAAADAPGRARPAEPTSAAAPARLGTRPHRPPAARGSPAPDRSRECSACRGAGEPGFAGSGRSPGSAAVLPPQTDTGCLGPRPSGSVVRGR